MFQRVEPIVPIVGERSEELLGEREGPVRTAGHKAQAKQASSRTRASRAHRSSRSASPKAAMRRIKAKLRARKPALKWRLRRSGRLVKSLRQCSISSQASSARLTGFNVERRSMDAEMIMFHCRKYGTLGSFGIRACTMAIISATVALSVIP